MINFQKKYFIKVYIYCIGWTLQIIPDIKKHTILRPWIFFPDIPFDVLKLMLTQSIPNSIQKYEFME